MRIDTPDRCYVRHVVIKFEVGCDFRVVRFEHFKKTLFQCIEQALGLKKRKETQDHNL